MAGFVQGVDREQVTLFPARLDEYVRCGRLTRLSTGSISMGLVSSMFKLDIGRPGYHPRMMLKLYIYGLP